jgi:hydroxymethylpyrimidine pyrophosphatase-like HAD family hydrolase
MEAMGLHVHVYELYEYYSNMDDDALKLYEKISGVKGVVYTDKPLSVLIREKGMKVRKVLALVAPQEKEGIYQALEKRFGNEFYVTYSAAFLVEITSRQYSKASAVERIAEYYGVPVQETVAIGDSLNDLPMLERAGLGIAVKNADENVKARARLAYGYKNDENAVGKIVEEFGFWSEEQ